MALQAIYNKPETDIAAMLKLCQNIGTETHKTQLLATAIATSLNPLPENVNVFPVARKGTSEENAGQPPPK